MFNLSNRQVVLGVSGSIAVYKAAELASRLTQAGALVDVVMTKDASHFLTPLTFRSLTGRPVYGDMFDPVLDTPEIHVELARRADIMVVAPATATTIARLAQGMADELVSLTALSSLAPLVVCPAMDSQMWAHQATQENVAILQKRGALIIEPEEGRLASGNTGVGRLAGTEVILGAIRFTLGQRDDLAGRKIVVSAGGTQEPIDPVRYIGNYSSGKMGYALAEAARDRGAKVALITAASLDAPYGVKIVHVQQAEEMRKAVVVECRGADAVVMAAAVADYRPSTREEQKIKRGLEEKLTVEMERTVDILAEISQESDLVKVGFAAESQDLLKNAREKVREKGLDLVAANNVTEEGSGFGTDTNRVHLLDRDGKAEELPLLSKYDVAQRILDRVVSLIGDERVKVG